MAEQLQPAHPLQGVVGWRSAGGSGGDNLPESLTQSGSGLYVQGLTELLDLSVVRHVVPRGKELAAWLQEINDDVLPKLASAALASQSVVPAKPLLQDTPLIPTPGRAANTVVKEGRFVALELRGRRGRGIATTLVLIGLQLSSAQTEVPLYIYREDSPTAVQELTLTVPRAGFPAWLTLAEPLVLDSDKAYFVGYYEDDLTGYAIRRDWAPGPCGCANDTWPDYQHYQPQSVTFASAAVNEDRSLPALSYAKTAPAALGLNVELLTICDPLQVLAANKVKLAEAVQMAIGIRVLAAIVASPNITQVTQRQDIQADALQLLYHFEAKLYGGKEQNTDNVYPGLLKRLTLDNTMLDAACLPKKAGISVGQLRR